MLASFLDRSSSTEVFSSSSWPRSSFSARCASRVRWRSREFSAKSRRIFCAVASKPKLEYYLPATLDAGRAPGAPAGRERHIFVGEESRACWLHPSMLRGGLPCEDEEEEHGFY